MKKPPARTAADDARSRAFLESVALVVNAGVARGAPWAVALRAELLAIQPPAEA